MVHTLSTCPTFPVNLWRGRTQEGVWRKEKDLTTSGSSLMERSWMALITIHRDDRRNITPRMTQALQRNKTLRHVTGRTPPADLHNDRDNDTTRGTGTSHYLPHSHYNHPLSQNWFWIISKKMIQNFITKINPMGKRLWHPTSSHSFPWILAWKNLQGHEIQTTHPHTLLATQFMPPPARGCRVH